jgi:hypothetical protein
MTPAGRRADQPAVLHPAEAAAAREVRRAADADRREVGASVTDRPDRTQLPPRAPVRAWSPVASNLHATLASSARHDRPRRHPVLITEAAHGPSPASIAGGAGAGCARRQEPCFRGSNSTRNTRLIGATYSATPRRAQASWFGVCATPSPGCFRTLSGGRVRGRPANRPERSRPRPLEDLDFHVQHSLHASQPDQFGTLVARQTLALPSLMSACATQFRRHDSEMPTSSAIFGDRLPPSRVSSTAR